MSEEGQEESECGGREEGRGRVSVEAREESKIGGREERRAGGRLDERVGSCGGMILPLLTFIRLVQTTVVGIWVTWYKGDDWIVGDWVRRGEGGGAAGGRLYEWVGGCGGDAAVVVPVARDLDVPELAPGAAPGVLHEPVVPALLVGAVAHHQHLTQHTITTADLPPTVLRPHTRRTPLYIFTAHLFQNLPYITGYFEF